MLKLPKRRILRNKRMFQEVYKKGRSWANRYLVLYVFPAIGLERKAGFAAGKKTWKCSYTQPYEKANA
jgi:ribonuclease P protein component